MESPKIDVLFILPPYSRFSKIESDLNFPLGLGYITAYLKSKNIESLIYNADYYKSKPNKPTILKKILVRLGLNKKRLTWYRFSKIFSKYFKDVKNSDHPIWIEYKNVLKTYNPKIIGISSKVIDLPSVMIMAEITKKINASIKIIVGGPSASTCDKELIENKNIDYVVIGEGEETTYELIDHLLNVKKTLNTINGIAYKEESKFVKTPARTLIENLDLLPFPNRDNVFVVNDFGEIQYIYETSDILTTRGCPYPCKFCACYKVWGNRIPRSRSIENIIEEILFLKNKHQQEYFIFWDDLFAVNKKRVFELCNKIIELKLNIKWLCFLRINNIEKDLLDILKQAGCVEIQIGIESGNNRILKYIGKNITVEQIKEKVLILKESGLRWLSFFIIGFPTETKQEIEDTLNLVSEIKPTQVCISIFAPYRGTEFYDFLASQKAIDENELMSDTYNVHSNYTGTMTNKDFKRIALKAMKYNDKYNQNPNIKWK